MDEDIPPVVPVVAVTVIILFIILFVKILKYCLFGRDTREDDVEQLEPSGEGSGCGSFFHLCLDKVEIEEGHGLDESPRRQGEERSLENEAIKDFGKGRLQNWMRFLEAEQAKVGDSKSDRLKVIRLTQQVIQLHLRLDESSLKATLVIGVDATRNVYGGYCVNLREKSLEFYVLKVSDFPWPVSGRNCPHEFEMKNLQFALATWSKSIRKYGKFRIYTDNNCIDSENEDGRDAKELLEHFSNCGRAVQVNESAYINRTKDLEGFAKYIQAADDLSRWEVDKALDFLCGLYGIDKGNVKGSVQLTRAATAETKAWYDKSPYHHQFVQRAKSFARNFNCENCFINTFLAERV